MGILKKWNSLSLIVRILIGLAVGALLGFAFPNQQWISVPGDLFVGSLKAVAPLLVFVLVASSLANSKGDSMKTALNSSGDALFTATAEFMEWKKQGKKLPL